MLRKKLFALPVVCALALAACSGTPQTLLSPSAAGIGATAVNPDGSTVKVGAPTDLSPNGQTVSSLIPTLSFTNPVGRFARVGFSYDIEVFNGAGTVVYSRTIGESATTSSHTLESELTFADTFTWRARVRLGTEVGPWSGTATFRTPDPPPPPPTPTTPTPTPSGGLPFPVPAACGPGDPSNRFACASAVASVSAEWRECARGNGVACHRFTRQVAFALAQSDAAWALIVAGPGGHACDCNRCGPSDGTMFREDTVVHNGNRVFDLIIGAGGPSPSLNWSPVPGPRAGDIPFLAPLCR